MGTRLIFRDLKVVTDALYCLSLSDCLGGDGVPGNSSFIKTVPETNTGGQVEHTEALGRMVLKELGKLPP